MKRNSVVGPLILILIGGLFLLKNLRPELPLMEIFGKHWPFLLIGWGVVRLGEVLFAAARSRPVPVPGISGGEWFLVVLICLVGAGSLAAHRVTTQWPQSRITMRGLEIFGESYDYSLSENREAPKNARVVIENARGNTRVVGADVAEVKVTGRKTVRAFDQNDADKLNAETPLEILTEGERIIVRTNHDRIGEGQRVSADLEITVPKGATVEGRGRHGDFDISEIAGGVDINSDNAGVRLTAIGGSVLVDIRRSDIVRAAHVKGPVEVKGRGSDVELESIEGPVVVSGSYSGDVLFRSLSKPMRFESSSTDLRVERVTGQVRVERGSVSGNDFTGPFRLTARSKDVQLSDFAQSVEIQIERGDVELRPARLPLSPIDARTRSGNIEIVLPEGAKFQIKASTARGEIDNDFGGGLKVEGEGRGATLLGAVGAGPLLQVATDRGSVGVRRGLLGDAPAPPKPPKPPLPAEKPIKVEDQ